MIITYNALGAGRKRLTWEIGDILQIKPHYLGAPTFAYDIGGYTVNREGNLEVPDGKSPEETKMIVGELEKMGFYADDIDGCRVNQEGDLEIPKAENPEETEMTTEELKKMGIYAVPAGSEDDALPFDTDADEQTASEEPAESVGLMVTVPAEKVNVTNLTKLLEAKGDLIKKALGIDALPVEVAEETVSFPWFQEMPDSDSAVTYTHFIAALCHFSTELKQVKSKAREVENEKYSFRCFLMRLGYVGPESKAERKILMQNLSGDAAFREGGRHEISE